jgi:hypothetical protein
LAEERAKAREHSGQRGRFGQDYGVIREIKQWQRLFDGRESKGGRVLIRPIPKIG